MAIEKSSCVEEIYREIDTTTENEVSAFLWFRPFCPGNHAVFHIRPKD
jgi:hypothetical protein